MDPVLEKDVKMFLKMVSNAGTKEVEELDQIFGTDYYTEEYIRAKYKYMASDLLKKYFPEEII